MENQILIIYITAPTQESADKIVITLLEKKLIACANMISSNSMYKENSEIVNSNEILILAKTSQKLYKRLKEEIESLHPYEIPCIIGVSTTANESYNNFINKETL